ncbi:MAG TPA: TonB-dependent receptor [Thermoanaerobaculia bacterium]|nr:TonB-dependent receptor [Thermoanaerobaculia bacterium]
MHALSRGAATLAALLFSVVLFAQNTASITGRVMTTDNKPVADASVTLLELRRTVKVSADGSFRFEALPAGHYHLHAESARIGNSVGDAELVAGQTLAVEIVMDPAVHYEEIVVSAGPDARRASEVYQPVNVMAQEEIAEQLQPTLGETLNREPGVASTYFGPGASRPVIRGLGGDRIRILEEGVGTGDASNVSPDHAVSVDPAKAQQIEIVRGPATLLYGSNAVGGLVNVIDNRVPAQVPAEKVTGTVDLRLGSVANERSQGLTLDGGEGKVAWHFDLSNRDAGDVEIPGPPDEFDDPAEFDGKLANSSLEARSGTLGASYVGSRGFFGAAVTGFSTNYGVPGHAHHEGEEEEEEAVRIDMDQRRLDLRGEVTELGPLANVRLRIGLNDYEHREIEGGEVGTRFTNERLETRIEARHRPIGAVKGVLGLQFSNNDFAAIGDEAFVPPNTIDTRALFAFEETTRGRFDFQFGARWEQQDVSAEGGLPDRSFAGVSVSGGAIFHPAERYAVAVSLARTVRMPTATELYANGPHVATRQFEVGDVDLSEETGLGIDVSLRKIAGRVKGQINLFRNSFDGYIYDRPTGNDEDDLPVFQYVQDDARFSGIELETHTELWHEGDHHLELELGGDYVRGRLTDGGDLPRVPPMRASLGLHYQRGQLSASAEAWRYATQRRVADLEEPTAGYTLVNASVSYRILSERVVHDILLRGTNLTDQLARSHVSPLKETVPLPGRDVTLAYRATF